ncbi:MAG: peroxiredoxin [Candidatus Competibacteraceae bacterium]
MCVTVGQIVPEFSATATGEQSVQLSALRGRRVVLYFYPKDHTPGCTIEGQQFRDRHAEFAALNTVIFGVSRDSLRSHENFRAKHDFPFALITDLDATLCQQFNVLKLKTMYGKKVLGVERSTFLIDADGVLRQAWRKVKVEGHVEAVLAAVKALP